jgi:predicted Zn-dependent protease
MKSRLSRSFAAILVAVFLGSFFAGAAYAADYLGAGYFPTNNLNRCHIGSYYSSQAQYASGTWSAATDLNMYYNCSGVHIWTSGMNYGNTGWTGYAHICNTSGQCDNQSAWDGTYRNCTARLNQYYLRNNDDNSIKWIALHEMGHCYSLGHRSDSTSVMNTQGITVLQPNQTDKDLINARY